GLDSATVRPADVTGAVREVSTAALLADPSLELVTASRVPLAPQPVLERLPAETVEQARWWERHLMEVITGVPPDSPPGTVPRPAYDPARRSLRQRELAKHEELALAGHRVGLSTLKRLRARYERDGLVGVIDHRAARAPTPAGYVDPRVVAATRQAIAEETGRSTGTVTRLRRRVEQILAEATEAGDRPVLPPERTFYRLVARLASGKHTFGSARTRRSLAKQPDGPFGTVTAARPGEWTQIDSTPLDVRVVHDDGTATSSTPTAASIQGSRPETAGGRSVTTPTTSPASGFATTTTAAGCRRPGNTCAPPRCRSASRRGTTPGSYWRPAAATRPPRPRSPPPQRTCSTGPKRAPSPGQASGHRQSSTRQRAADTHRVLAGYGDAPRPPLPRSGPARHPAQPTAARTLTPPAARQSRRPSGPPRSRPRRRR
ncbi:MAG TPA: hypothetical protein VG123_43130, partial [Streptosporangiaceae bacterium]|nr:hypothetical protein [Streptosporangiaceae bacterium]